jgi:hypothetical protein
VKDGELLGVIGGGNSNCRRSWGGGGEAAYQQRAASPQSQMMLQGWLTSEEKEQHAGAGAVIDHMTHAIHRVIGQPIYFYNPKDAE